MGLAEPSQASAAWGAQTAASWSASGQSSTVAADIVCAINTFGQNDIYMSPAYNAWCFSGRYDQSEGYGLVPTFQKCSVTFTGAVPPPNSKRDSMPGSERGVHMAMAMADDGDNTMLTSLTRRPKERWHFTFHLSRGRHGPWLGYLGT